MKWGILDFPEELFVKIEEEYLREIISSIGSQHEVARQISIKHPILHRYLRGRRISLERLLKIINLSSESEELKSDLESHIIDIKAPSSRAIEIRPPFPLEMNKAFARILGHLLGDGNVRKSGGHNVRYGNTDPVLVESFIKDIDRIFNGVEYYKHTRNYKTERGTKKFTEISYPSIIGRILTKIIGHTGTFEGKIPDFVFDTDEEIKSEVIKAIFDDEGTVSENGHALKIQIANKTLVWQIKDLLAYMKIKSSLHSRGEEGSTMYSLSIYQRKSQKKFFNLVGATKNTKKYIRLKKYIKSLKPTKEETEKMITESMGREGKSYTDLLTDFPLSEATFVKYLKILKRKGYIKKNCEGKWELN